MTLKVLYAGAAADWPDYRAALPRCFDALGLDAEVSTDLPPGEVDYVVYAPNGPVSDFTGFTRAKAVLSLWAGVEKIVGNASLTQPLTRMVDRGLEEGMVEYVTGHVLRHHLAMDKDITNDAAEWRYHVPPLARNRPVGILGLGELGTACARALRGLNFPVHGWGRRPRSVDGVICHSGEDGLEALLRQVQILVLLLPSTPETQNLMNAARLALMPKGAFIINPGRGTLIDDDALLAALDRGQIAHATLDTFRVEPLPADHPYWAHPGVTVTAHVASDTRAETASEVVAENIRRSEAGEPLKFLVDRSAGY